VALEVVVWIHIFDLAIFGSESKDQEVALMEVQMWLTGLFTLRNSLFFFEASSIYASPYQAPVQYNDPHQEKSHLMR